MGQLSGVVEEALWSRKGQPAAGGDVAPDRLQVRPVDILRRTAMRRQDGGLR